MSVIPAEGATSGNYVFTVTEYTEGTSHTDYDGVYRDSLYGDEGELFDVDLSRDHINSPEFGAVFRVQPGIDDDLIQVDCVSLQVFYYLTGDIGEIPGDLGDSFQAVVFGPPGLVIVGLGGTITTSFDFGATWVDRDSGVSTDLFDIVWFNDEFITVGAYGTIISSPDGITWTLEDRTTSQWLFDIEVVGDQIVIVGSSDTGMVGETLDDLSNQVVLIDPYEVPT